MDYSKYLNSQEFIDNNSKRIPVCIVVDCSGSMKEFDGTSKKRIDRVNDGISLFYEGVKNNIKASRAVEVEIIQVGNDAKVISDFASTDKNPPKLISLGEQNDLESGVRKALKELDKRKEIYKAANISYYQPWLLIMSDGGVDSNKIDFRETQKKVREREMDDKLSVFPIYVQGKPVWDEQKNKYVPIQPKTYDKRLKLMSDFSSYENRLINIDLADSKSFEKLFQFLHRSASSVASNRGIINDSNYGNFKKQEKTNITNVPLYEYHEDDVYGDALELDDEIDYSILNENIKKEQQLEQKRIEEAKKELEKIDTEKEIIPEVIKSNRLIVDIYVNDKKVYPVKNYDGNNLIMQIQLMNNDRIKIITNEGKTIYNEVFHSDGRYEFIINEKNIDVKLIQNIITSSKKNKTIENMNKEIEDIIKNISDWDAI
jgi:uncharacterized protein YegL